MNIEYLRKGIVGETKIINWVHLRQLHKDDIPKVGTHFLLKVDGVVYTKPCDELYKILLWQELNRTVSK